MDPIRLLDYPCEDVFDLINGMVDYNSRKDTGGDAVQGERYPVPQGKQVILRPADDSWF